MLTVPTSVIKSAAVTPGPLLFRIKSVSSTNPKHTRVIACWLMGPHALYPYPSPFMQSTRIAVMADQAAGAAQFP